MAHERSRRKPEGRRWPAAPESPADPIGRLDDVLATLEKMLDERGVPPVAHPRGAPGPEGPSGDLGDPGGPEALPLLRDVVTPAAERSAGGTEGGSEAARVKEDEPEGVSERAPDRARVPLPLGFEIISDGPLLRIDELDRNLDSPDVGPDGAPGGERYGDAPPPSLDPEVYRHLIDRLANEIDVIVQTGTEEAMQRAAVDIAARVREHVAIILPEVIEELVRMSNRPAD